MTSFFLLSSLRNTEMLAFGMGRHVMGCHGMKQGSNVTRHSQLSSCIVHVWMSMGKFLRSMGQDRISVSLQEADKRETG